VSEKPRVPAVEGWFTVDEDAPALTGTRCRRCGSWFFPKETRLCRNPSCSGAGDDLEEMALSRRGRVWSATTNHYAPPPPYVAPDPFEPYTVAAVELGDEQMVVLGQYAGDGTPHVGEEVELVLDVLYEDDDAAYLVWKWAPAATGEGVSR
jgi:uncharacterized OB-fold protein